MSTATVMPMTTASDLPLDQSNQIEDDVVTIGRNEFEPAITNEQFQEYERTQDDAWGTKRRIALISLCRSKADLMDGFGKDRGIDTLFAAIDEINAWSDHLKAQIDMADTAIARLMIVASAIVHNNTNQGE